MVEGYWWVANGTYVHTYMYSFFNTLKDMNSFPGITSFEKAPAVSLKLTQKLERQRFLKEADQNLLYTPLKWTQMEAFATQPFFS